MSKLPHVGTTIFTTMSRLAQEYGAINLAQGFPDFDIDTRLAEAVKSAATKPVHQYFPMPGYPPLLQSISRLIEDQYGRIVDPNSDLLITAGATQAIFTTIMALVHNNDEVLILDPSYDCYAPAVVLAGGTPVHVDLNDDYSPNWEAIATSITDKTKLLIINNPHNPSGKVWDLKDIESLLDLMNKHQHILLLSDEVYEFIYFSQKHLSIHLFDDLFERSITVSSFGKTFHVTGWKIGYMVAPEHLMNEIKKVHQFNVFSVNSISQFAIQSYLSSANVSELKQTYLDKREMFKSLLNNSRFKLLPCEGTYFQVLDYSEISDLDDVTFCNYLTKEVGVAAIPLSVFNKSGKDRRHIRLCFAKKTETLIQAAEKLCRI
jgi:methionine aminotransferase